MKHGLCSSMSFWVSKVVVFLEAFDAAASAEANWGYSPQSKRREQQASLFASNYSVSEGQFLPMCKTDYSTCVV